jgi:hypothetical protein
MMIAYGWFGCEEEKRLDRKNGWMGEMKKGST